MRFGRPLVFFLLVLGLCSWHLDPSINDNTVSRAAMVAAIVEHGSLCIDPYHELTHDKALVDGHYYSEKAPLPALLVVPFWYAFHKLGWIEPKDHGLLTIGLLRLGGFICGSLPLALIITITWWRLRNTRLPLPRAWLAIVPFIGSFLFVYCGSFHGHLVAALFLLVAWLARKRDHALLSGLFASAAVLSEYSLFFFPLVWLLQDIAQRKWKLLGSMVFGGLPGFLLLGVMNLMVTGKPWVLPYANVAEHIDTTGGTFGLGATSIPALFNLLFSSYRGLFFFAPVTVLCAFVALRWMKRTGWRAALMHPLVLPSIALTLTIAGHIMWWGGWAFGPRHLTSIAVLLMAAALPRMPDRPWADGALVYLGIAGLVIGVVTKCTTWYALPSDEVHPFTHMVLPNLFSRSFTMSQWPVSAGFSPIMGTVLFGIAFLWVMRYLQRAEVNT
ncbi:MAG TPA: hypothetical protein PK760_06515 [Flavobacteriales bacterium]|nr:hypothetical protein [Flavobacteriales bacterium]